MNKEKLNKARVKVDLIDKNIFKLIKVRSKVVSYMLSLKQYKKEIVDHQRINKILKNIKKKSIQDGVDPKVTKKIWKSMIWAYVDYQRRNFKKK
ncbi:chorismate mutase [Pelagibacteraceae bacterium]|nr:chorismate mutase [Pelagibacteraceae bacterium]